MLASALAHLGRLDEARESIEALHRLNPEIDLALVRDYWPISEPHLLDRLLDGLQKAGLAA